MGRLILITNDDGIDAGGIRQLAETAKAFGEVWVVAPESQRSGKSHSVTYLEPLYVRERPGYMDGVKAYECSGVPVDCVRVGIHLLGRKPDVVLYEEPLNESTVNGAVRHIMNADMLIVAGTSLTVYPAAGLIRYFRGRNSVLINRDANVGDDEFSLVIHGKVGEVLGSLVV